MTTIIKFELNPANLGNNADQYAKDFLTIVQKKYEKQYTFEYTGESALCNDIHFIAEKNGKVHKIFTSLERDLRKIWNDC